MQQKVKSQSEKICYLCGFPLKGKGSKDHVPPSQLYAKSIRKSSSLNLLTLPTHSACKKSYQHDEDYFVNSLLPLALSSKAGQARLLDTREMVRKGEQLRLVEKVVNEFEDRPSGLYLPNSKVVKRAEHKRITRVGWKIIRGLYFHHNARFLPEDTPYKLMDRIIPGERPSLVLETVISHGERQGAYPEVFDYRYLNLPEGKWPNMWAFQLWESITMCYAFRNPSASES
jgi:hypothetical protein